MLRTTREHLNFMLPDGGWIIGFGSRSYKWSWWGSRTSDGCLAGFAALSRHDPVFAAAVQKNLELLKQCTHDGLLYGGPMYRTAGNPLASITHSATPSPWRRLCMMAGSPRRRCPSCHRRLRLEHGIIPPSIRFASRKATARDCDRV